VVYNVKDEKNQNNEKEKKDQKLNFYDVMLDDDAVHEALIVYEMYKRDQWKPIIKKVNCH